MITSTKSQDYPNHILFASLTLVILVSFVGLVAENCIPASIVAALTHDIFINGCQVNFSIDGCKDVEITCLYPDISFRTIDECFNDYAAYLLLKHGNKINSPNSMVNWVSVPPTCA